MSASCAGCKLCAERQHTARGREFFVRPTSGPERSCGPILYGHIHSRSSCHSQAAISTQITTPPRRYSNIEPYRLLCVALG